MILATIYPIHRPSQDVMCPRKGHLIQTCQLKDDVTRPANLNKKSGGVPTHIDIFPEFRSQMLYLSITHIPCLSKPNVSPHKSQTPDLMVQNVRGKEIRMKAVYYIGETTRCQRKKKG